MLLIPLPDLAVLRICHYLPCADVIRLKDEDYRFREHYRKMERSAQIIKHNWLTMKSRGRNYFRDMIITGRPIYWKSLHSIGYHFFQLLMLKTKIKNLKSHASLIKYHTIFPRRRVVIPRCQLRNCTPLLSSRYIYEIRTYPKMKIDIVTLNNPSSIVIENVGPDAILPMTVMPFEYVKIMIDNQKLPMYLCYTEIYIPIEIITDQLQKLPLHNLNIDVRAGPILEKDRKRTKVNPNLLPVN